ncbi:MAG: SpoIIE family protein phosphatase [Armatimonadetes bacterium]|nr:SpoIIE family protein phosphatase [Armatimonadota bacterium]
MAQKPPPPNSITGERALRDLRSLWPVPTFVLAVIVGLLSVVEHGGPVSWLWSALAVLVVTVTCFLLNRRAHALAAILQARAAEIAASRDRLAALNDLGQALAAHRDLTPTLDAVCARTAAALRASRVALALREPGEDEQRTRAAAGFTGGLPAPDVLALLPDVLQAPLTGPGGRALGTLYVQRPDKPLDSGERAMLAAIAAQAALAITNARLYEESRRHAGNLRALARRVAEAVAASTGDLRRVAAPIAEQAVNLLACDGAGVYLLSEDRRALTPAASHPAPPESGAGGPPALPLDETPLLETLWTAGGPLAFEDARVLGGVWADSGRTLIVAPLRGSGQGLLGALVLRWNRRHSAGDEELGLIAALAGFAAVAIENARLAADAQAARQVLSEKNARLLDEARRRGQELRALVRRVGDALAAGHSPERVARLVTEQARQMIPCRRVVFSVPEDSDGAGPASFRPLAASGDEADAWASDGWREQDFPFLRGVLERAHPLVLSDVAEDGRLTQRERTALRRADVAAMLLAPVRGRGARTLGLLALFWTDGPYTPAPEEFETVDLLASQAAAALENARLYRDLERAEAELTAQLAAAQSARDFVQRILQNVQAAVLVLSAEADLVILSANALAEAMPDPERERDGLVGRRLADVFPGLDDVLGDALQRAVARGASSTLPDAEYCGFARGATYWTFSVTPQRDPATRRVSQIILLALETTDRIRLLRENEENARREQQRANELDATLRSLGDGVALCDDEGRLVSVNRAGQAILGGGPIVPGERVEVWAARIGLCYPSGQPVPPGAVPLTRVLRTALALEPEEYAVFTGDGERRLIELTATPVLASGPLVAEIAEDAVMVTGAVAVFRDVTALRYSQQREAAANRRVETLVDISRRLNATQDLDEIHAIVTEGALALLPGVPDGRALLYDLDGETKTLRLRAMRPEAHPPRRPATLQDSRPFTLPFDATSPLLWQVYVSRQTMVGWGGKDAGPADSLLLRGGVTSLPHPASALILPLLARDTVSGHLALTSSASDAFDDPRLVDALTNLAALAVIARTNARLYGQMKQRVDELDALWTVGQATASKLEITEVVDTLTDRVRAVMGGEACTLALFERDGGARRLRRQGTAWREWALAAPEECLCDACDQVTQEAALKGEPISLTGRRNPGFPLCHWRAFAGQSGEHSVLAVPLRSGDEILGALTVFARGTRPFAPDQVKLLGTLASLAVAAVRNAQSYAHEQNIAETLQKAFLPGAPTRMPGLDIAERYHPTRTEEARIGGDYYDFLPLGPRKLAVIIGDISGKGLAAAVYTAMAKYTLRAFAAQDMPPAEVVSRANRAIARHTVGEVFSTLFYGVVDLDAATLTYVNAGHEPPQLARADGTIHSLESTGLMLGAFADAEWDAATVPLAPDDVLALFTDGLPDARAEDGMFFGEDGVRACLAAARAGDAAAVADALHGAAVRFAAGGRLRDDIALLVLRVVGQPSHPASR